MINCNNFQFFRGQKITLQTAFNKILLKQETYEMVL